MPQAKGPSPAARWLSREFLAPGGAFPGIVGRVVGAPKRIEWLIEGVSSTDPRIRLGCSKALRLVAFAEPRLVYPYFGFFVGQLDSANSVLRWNAEGTLACLAPADRQNKLDG